MWRVLLLEFKLPVSRSLQLQEALALMRRMMRFWRLAIRMAIKQAMHLS